MFEGSNRCFDQSLCTGCDITDAEIYALCHAMKEQALKNAYAVSYMNLIEHRGSGIPRIIARVKAAGLLQPEFIGGEVDLRINIYRGQIGGNNLKNDPDDLNSSFKDELDDLHCDSKNDLEFRLIEVIRRNPEMTQKDLVEKLSVSASTVKRILMKMKQEGKVIREGSNRKGKWFLFDKI